MKEQTFNIVLIGFMGSGKSTVGRYLADVTGRRCYDVDSIIEQHTGLSITEIFHSYGEAYFRSQERAVIANLSLQKGSIIACGGGAVLDKDNVTQLKQGGKLIWLQASPGAIADRLKQQHDRPLLEANRGNDIVTLLNMRRPLYEAAADYRVQTDGRQIDQIASDILAMLTCQNTLDLRLPEDVTSL